MGSWALPLFSRSAAPHQTTMARSSALFSASPIVFWHHRKQRHVGRDFRKAVITADVAPA